MVCKHCVTTTRTSTIDSNFSSDGLKREWTFALTDYQLVHERVAVLNPDVSIGHIPRFVLDMLLPKRSADVATSMGEACLLMIEPKLAGALMPFQKEGVYFGIGKRGRCMIADEMGLGKTYQALAIADFYRDDWPLLICTTAATRLVGTHVWISFIFLIFDLFQRFVGGKNS